MGSQHEHASFISHRVTPSDIRAASNALVLDMEHCDDVVIYAGFPMLVSIDGDSMTISGSCVERGATAASYIIYTQGVVRIRGAMASMTLSFPAGLGSGSDNEVYGLHAVTRIDGARHGVEIVPYAAESYLPIHSSRISFTLTGDNAATSTIYTPGNDAIFGQGSTYLLAHTPSEIWVNALSWKATAGIGGEGTLIYPPLGAFDFSNPPAAATVPILAELGIYTFNGPVGRQESIWRVKLAGAQGLAAGSEVEVPHSWYDHYEFGWPGLHLPCKAVYDALGGVNGGFSIAVSHSRFTAAVPLNFELFMNFRYRH